MKRKEPKKKKKKKKKPKNKNKKTVKNVPRSTTHGKKYKLRI